jgi:signal transduction histidine kinase
MDGSVVLADSEFRTLFEATPACLLVLDPQWVIVAVSDAYLHVTMTERRGVVGKYLFDVFPDNPGDPTADGVANLSASLERVARDLRPDGMADQHYDIRRPDSQGGGFEVRFWRPVNSPVLDQAGELAYVIHRVDDVTDQVQTEKDLERASWNNTVLEERNRIGRELNDRVLLRISANGSTLAGVMNRTENPEVARRIREVIADLDATVNDIRLTVFPSVDQ